MAASALSRALRRPSSISPLRYAASLHCRPAFQDVRSGIRQFSIINDISKQLEEAKSNPEIQKSLKELNELKEDFKVRTKRTTEKLHKSLDGAWTEAEATSKKVSTNVKEKISAAKEEVKESLGLGKQESSESTGSSTSSFSAKDDSHCAKDGSSSRAGGSSQSSDTSTKAPVGHSDLFGKIKSTLSSASPTFSLLCQKLKQTKVSDFAKKGYDIVKEELSSNPSCKRRMQYTRTPDFSGIRSTKTDIVFVPSKQSPLGEKWEALKKKMQGHPIFKRVSGISEPVVTKGQELAEDMRERWETSDHPVVHKIQDLNESVLGETATALSFKEIRRRDPSFCLPDFVAEVQEMIRPVLNAYLQCDTEALKKYCSLEVIERCLGERKAFESQDMFLDTKILHISEVDVRETKMMGSTPIIIIGFQTQQIYCIRDREGSIKAGGKDTIQTVHYAWAMQQMDIDELGEGALYPVFRLREMQQIGVQSLI